MDKGMIMLIMNIAFGVILLLGFLFGLHGVKKSALSLAFFFGCFIVTLIITPFVTSAVLQIKVPSNGQTIAISELISNAVQESAILKELASNGSNVQSLVNNAPKIIGNLVVYMALLIILGFIFWIAYCITAHCIFKKKKDKNPIGKDTPANVTATGNVKYQHTENPKKYRVFGGLVGAVHALLFMVLLLIPVIGVTSLVGEYAFATEESSQSTAMITLDINQQTNDINQTSQIEFTPTAKLLQEYLPVELLDIIFSVNDSILGNACQIADIGDVVFNTIAKCKVNGQNVVLKKELNNLAVIYDNTEFLMSIDFSNAQSIKTINFNKIRKAVNALTDSSILKTIVPEVANKYLDWLTMEDIASLDESIQSWLQTTREELDKDPNLKQLVYKLKSMLESENKLVSLLKSELLNVVDICELVVKNDIMNLILDEQQTNNPDLTIDILKILNKDDNKILNQLIDKVFDSELINVIALTGFNYGIDFANTFLNQYTTEKVSIGKIDLLTAKNRFDASVVKTLADLITDIMVELEQDYKVDENTNYDYDKFLLDNSTYLITQVGAIIDDIKNMAIINEFNTLRDIVSALKKVEFTVEGEKLKVIELPINLDIFTDQDFSFEIEFKNYATAYDLVSHLLEINYEDLASLKTIDFENLQQAVSILLNSELISYATPNIVSKLLDWTLSENAIELPSSLQGTIANIREFCNTNVYIKDLVTKLDQIASVEENIIPFIESELYNILDLADIALNSGMLDNTIVVDEQMTTMQRLDFIMQILHNDNNKVLYQLLDIVSQSELLNDALVAEINFGLQELSSMLSQMTGAEISLGKIDLLTTQNTLDIKAIKNLGNVCLTTYFKIKDYTNDAGDLDIENFVKENIDYLLTNVGSVLDDIKQMKILKEFDILSNLVDALKKYKIKDFNGKETTIQEFICDLDLILDDTYSFSKEFVTLGSNVKEILNIEFTESVGDTQVVYSIWDKIMTAEFDYIIKNLTEEQTTLVVNTVTKSKFFKPFGTTLLNLVNQTIQEQLGEEIADFIPDDIDLSEASEEIITVVNDVKEVLTIAEQFDEQATLKENLTNLDDAQKQTIVDTLIHLQDSKENDGVFKELYNQIVEMAKDDTKTGLEGLSAVIEEYTDTSTDTIDWQAIMEKYLSSQTA